MTNVTSILGPVSVVAGLFVMAAGAYALLRSQYLRTSVELLRANNGDLVARVETLEAEDTRKTEQLTKLRAENDALLRMATGRDLLEALAVTLSTQHQETLTRLGGLARDTADRLDDIKGIVGARREREARGGRQDDHRHDHDRHS